MRPPHIQQGSSRFWAARLSLSLNRIHEAVFLPGVFPIWGVSFLWGYAFPAWGGVSHEGGVSDGGGVWKGTPRRCHTEEEADREGTAPVNGKPRRGGVFRHFLMI